MVSLGLRIVPQKSAVPPVVVALRIRLLGELQVTRPDSVVPLPASKRTRALLGYLVATRVPQLRQTLCDLLWDGPDDPRGALRWSLSKLRDVVDDEAATRLQADRERVGFVAQCSFIDVDRVDALAVDTDEAAPLAALDEAAALLRGEFLDGLDLPSCHRFHHWCMAERERLGALRRKVLTRLVDRLQDDPQQALPHARALVTADPLSESAHAALLRLLTKAGRKQEADAHCQRVSEMLRHEVGTEAAEAVRAALREARRKRPPVPAAGPAGEAVRDGFVPGRPRTDWASALVGREAEQHRIAEAVDALFDGGLPKPLIFLGDPGIGKSRLLETLAAEATGRGARAASARCYEAEMLRPYGCFIDALRGLPDELIPEELRPDISALRSGPLHPADLHDRDRLLAKIAALTQSLAEARPFALMIDDLQWLDEASASLFHFLARSKIPHLLTAGTARPGEIEDNVWARRLLRSLAHDGALERVEVGALDARQTATLLGLDPGSDEASSAFHYSSGNPLLTLELARARRHGADVRGQGLDSLIADQLARLNDQERELIVWAATIGRQFRPLLLGACLGLPETVLFTRLERLQRLGLLRPTADEYFDFTHDLVRQGVYRLQSQPHRRFLHRQIARALSAIVEDEPNLYGDLVHHAGLAEDHGTAARACIAVGERCLRLCANPQAAEIAERGLAHLMHLPAGTARIQLQVGLLGVKTMAAAGAGARNRQALLGELERAVALSEMSGLHRDAAQALMLTSVVHFWSNDTERTRAATLRAEKISRTADAATHFRQAANTAYCLLAVESSVPRALALIGEAEALAETHNLQFVDLDISRALAARWAGDLETATNLTARALTFAELREDRYRQTEGMVWLAIIALERGSFDEVEAHCDEFERKREQIDVSHRPIMESLRALARLARGRPDAEASLQAGMQQLRSLDDKARLAFVLNTLADLRLRAGAHEPARIAATEALAVAGALRRSTEIIVAHTLLARVAAAAGDGGETVVHLAAARSQDPTDVRSARARLHLEQATRATGPLGQPGIVDAARS